MFFQLGAGAIIEDQLLRHFNICFKTRIVNGVTYDQPSINRRMARQGSIDGSFATIDLSSASDTISYGLVEFLLPKLAFSCLDSLRSRRTSYGGIDYELNMFSSMGNGFTFPLQTMIFSALVVAVYEELGIAPNKSIRNRNYSVFGDDIICVRNAYDVVCSTLAACGFTVNYEKSFNSGPFRESCGCDYFKGHDIRGVYLKGIDNAADVYSAFNRLSRWSVISGIYLVNVLLYLKGLVDFRPIPFDEDDAAGFKMPTDQLTSPKRDPYTGALIYRALVQRDRQHKISEADIDYNSFGHLACAIGGYVRNDKYGVRVLKPTYKVVKRMTPCWDHVTHAGLTSRDFYYLWSLL